ncbi:Rsp5p-dependent ubiquitination, sorting of cargo proteins at the multivesicular body [Nowakowskiella sp. JEL0407]|nr:Rsp5p-dependent ubiquitination, sorting of cargo proteins at the multivesicular body [Nowakowskiella sp. JEL0407]
MFRTYVQAQALTTQLSSEVLQQVLSKNFRVSIYAQNETINSLPDNTAKSSTASGLFLSDIGRNVAVALVGERSSLFGDGGTTFHELGHAAELIGMNVLNRTFDASVKQAFNRSISNGLWKNAYASTNDYEYWAEGSRIWFGCSTARYQGEPPNIDGLKTYDPELYSLLSLVYVNTAKSDWTYSCRDTSQPICDQQAAPPGSDPCSSSDTISRNPFSVPSPLPVPEGSQSNSTFNGPYYSTNPSYSYIAMGIAVGGLLLIAVLGTFFYYRNKRRRAQQLQMERLLIQTPYGDIPMIALNDPNFMPPMTDVEPSQQHQLSDLIRIIELNGARTNQLCPSNNPVIELSMSSLAVEFKQQNTDDIFTPKSVKSQYPLTFVKPEQVDFYYYEVEIVQKPASSQVTVGFCDEVSLVLTSCPGWTIGSVGYSSDGMVYCGSSPSDLEPAFAPIAYSDTFKEGDIIGVAHIPAVGATYFTVNGVSKGEVRGLEYPPDLKNLFACVGTDGLCKLRLNFGSEQFLYADANFVSEEGLDEVLVY